MSSLPSTSSPSSYDQPFPAHSPGHRGHRRSVSSQSLFIFGSQSPSATSSSTKFNDKSGCGSSCDNEDEDVAPPLELQIQVLPSFLGGVPLTTSPEQITPPMPSKVMMTRPAAPVRRSSSPAVLVPSPPPPTIATSEPGAILLSNGKPLQSSLKRSRVSSFADSSLTEHSNPAPSTSVTATSIDSDPTAFSAAFTGHVRAASTPSPSKTSWPSAETKSPSSARLRSPRRSSTSSEPSMSPRNVHFPPLSSDLEHVLVFSRKATPSSLLASSRAGEEGPKTETETERDTGGAGGYQFWGRMMGLQSETWLSKSGNVACQAEKLNESFPFPREPGRGRTSIAGTRIESDGAKGRKGIENVRRIKMELDMDSTMYPVPRPESVRDALLGSVNMFLEKIHLDSPPSSTEVVVLEGTFLVRNIAFEKQVFVRFTTDDWSTVSEVRGRWVGSCGTSHLAELHSGFGSAFDLSRTLGDLIVFSTRGAARTDWDRFAFKITLPPAIGPGRIIELVGRFIAENTSEEWWDNCGGKNWKVGFRETEIDSSFND